MLVKLNNFLYRVLNMLKRLWLRFLYFGCDMQYIFHGVRVGCFTYFPLWLRVEVTETILDRDINIPNPVHYISHWQYYKQVRFIMVRRNNNV